MSSGHMSVQGKIFKIERFAIHDGPGIRTVVFMKGCPLRCRWCSSPESQRVTPETVYHAEKCVHCGACVEVCPAGAIAVASNNTITTEIQRCEHCGACVAACPEGARKLIGEVVTAEAVLNEVEKDAVFYYQSDGGVTLSGGEPTMQPEFASAILKGCLERGFHTAMETCGHVNWEALDRLLSDLSLIYVDIKHMSADAHRRITGRDNALILENIKRIDHAYTHLPIIVRIPVIPGVNDTADNIAETAAFVSRLSHVERIELLPYHRYGLAMYNALSRDYALQAVDVPSDENLEMLADIIRSHGVSVQIGG